MKQRAAKLALVRFRTAVSGATALLLVIVFAGCSSNSTIGEVTGKVTYHGQPLKGAKLEFTPAGDGRMSVGYTDDQGKYTLQYTLQQTGAKVGKHRVNIRIYSETGVPPVHIPAEYSNMEFDVMPGSNEFDIDIK